MKFFDNLFHWRHDLSRL